jgi:plastocyanin
MALSGCQHTGLGERYGTPTITRTGEIKEIIIRDDDVSPAIVTAHPGDEIRWINRQQDEARVIFLLPMEGQLSCQRGFGGLMSANENQYTAKLRANETASVCFKHPSEIKYVVRANSALSNGEEHIAGTINIGGRQGLSNKEDGGKRAQSSQ